MLFNKLYPDAKKDEQQNCDGDAVVKVDNFYKCCLCDNLTQWLSLSFEGGFCSEECLATMWKEYFEAVKEAEQKYTLEAFEHEFT